MKSNIIIISMAFGLIFGGKTFAQDSDPLEFKEFNNLYFGFELGKNDRGIEMVQSAVWLQLGNNYYKIKGTSSSAPKPNSKRYRENSDPQLTDLSLILGKNYTFLKHHQLHVGSGLSMVTYKAKNKDADFSAEEKEANMRYSIGLPVELRYSLNFNRNIALSLSAHASANPVRNFSGLSAGIMFGLF